MLERFWMKCDECGHRFITDPDDDDFMECPICKESSVQAGSEAVEEPNGDDEEGEFRL